MIFFRASFFIILFLFFTGCADNSALKHFQNDKASAYALQYTQKTDLVSDKQIEGMLFATYLNSIDTKYESDKLNSFVIGIHIVNKEKRNLFFDGYEVYLNGKKPLSKTILEKDSPYLKSIPLKNHWAKYFLVHFENNQEKNLNLKLTYSKFGEVQLNFVK